MHGKEVTRNVFFDFCGGKGRVARQAEKVYQKLSVVLVWKTGGIRVDLKNHGVYMYITELVEETLVDSGMLHLPCET